MIQCEVGLQWSLGECVWVDAETEAIKCKAAWLKLSREGWKRIAFPISPVLHLRVQKLALLPIPKIPMVPLVPEILTNAHAPLTLAGASGGVEQHAVSGQRQ